MNPVFYFVIGHFFAGSLTAAIDLYLVNKGVDDKYDTVSSFFVTTLVIFLFGYLSFIMANFYWISQYLKKKEISDSSFFARFVEIDK